MTPSSGSVNSIASDACLANSCGGEIRRNNFEPWEIDLILDLETCQLPSRRRLEILRQYQRAVERQMESGPGPPIKLSHFLFLREQAPGAPPTLGLPSDAPDGPR